MQRLSSPTPFWRYFNCHPDLLPPVAISTRNGEFLNRSQLLGLSPDGDELEYEHQAMLLKSPKVQSQLSFHNELLKLPSLRNNMSHQSLPNITTQSTTPMVSARYNSQSNLNRRQSKHVRLPDP